MCVSSPTGGCYLGVAECSGRLSWSVGAEPVWGPDPGSGPLRRYRRPLQTEPEPSGSGARPGSPPPGGRLVWCSEPWWGRVGGSPRGSEVQMEQQPEAPGRGLRSDPGPQRVRSHPSPPSEPGSVPPGSVPPPLHPCSLRAPDQSMKATAVSDESRDLGKHASGAGLSPDPLGEALVVEVQFCCSEHRGFEPRRWTPPTQFFCFPTRFGAFNKISNNKK